MSRLHILFVEDEEAQQDMLETAVRDWNASEGANGREFQVHVKPDVEDAISALECSRYDAALFDLRVKTKAKSQGRAGAAGNELARSALKDCGIPVGIITADDSYLEDDLRKAPKVRVFDKNARKNATGNAYDNAVAWLASEWGMMSVLRAARQRIDTSAADIFLRRLWPKWEAFEELQNAEAGDLTNIVTRQYVSHIAELLGLDGPDNVNWHPFEHYINPALLEARAQTGDIFKFDGDLWVVMTPQCDMAVQKVPNVLLVNCELGIGKWQENIEALAKATSNTQRTGPLRFLSDLVNQNMAVSKHFLPPLPGSKEPLIAAFPKMKMMPMEDLNGRLDERIASISAPFLSNLVQRFGAYISRMGQPNIDVKYFT